MWIIRFNKVTTSDYNFVNRILKKTGFVPRKYSRIILIKAVISYIFKKSSWRTISKEFGINYITLFNFFNFIKEKQEFRKILHRFIDNRIILFVGDKLYITSNYLDNNLDIIILTKEKLKSKL